MLLRLVLWLGLFTREELEGDEMTESEMKSARDAAFKEAYRLNDALLSPEFGWTRAEPPKSGVVETSGFSSLSNGLLGYRSMHHMPGLVNAADFPIPPGTLWRIPR